MCILGIETSCDETAAAIIDQEGRVLGHTVASQTRTHQQWGGVVPNLAAREHLHTLEPLVTATLKEAQKKPEDLDAIAATCGPGLIGSLLIGATFAKAMALGLKKPFIAINHLEGHALLPCLTHHVTFPYLLLLISGGHTQFTLMHDLGRYETLGESLDDALGEAFDKTARLLGLSYPGGPALEALAKEGNPTRFSLTPPLKGRPGCDFSFSGLKTAVADLVKQCGPHLTESTRADIAAAFQKTVSVVLVDRLGHAIQRARLSEPSLKTLVISGGVAANRFLFTELQKAATRHDLSVVTPPPALCTDNGIMIAFAGLKRYKQGLFSPLDVEPQARWPLCEVTTDRKQPSPPFTRTWDAS
ncbi:tRNA (adenosine(37)-N6)-threonylcarbamoyltransferase complex transferase subunit TsaD [bacterium NHP-B]|nr:tRNA (adenosine(37)-N6)-threonylcarbamoyltransferase complex transferase subunit TsaD [bacterium NHP-B]